MADRELGRWRRPVMKAKILLVSVAALAIEADLASAHAAAWCLVGGDSGRHCAYHTFEQCLASRAGGASFCEQNPNYTGDRSDENRPARSGRRR